MTTLTKKFKEKFLDSRDDTGRFIVYSFRTGKRYCVEPIGDGRGGDWGSENPATKVIEHKKGDGKHKGSVTEKESLITVKNGFKPEHIHQTDKGESVMGYIDELDAKYPTV